MLYLSGEKKVKTQLCHLLEDFKDFAASSHNNHNYVGVKEGEDEDGQQQQRPYHHQKQLQEDQLGENVRKAKEVRNVRPSGSKGKGRK